MSDDLERTRPKPPATPPAGEQQRWLDEPKHVTWLFRALIAVCALLVLAELTYVKHPHFAYEGWFAFFAVAGFVAYLSIVTLARGLRRLVRRDEDYYEP